MTILEKQKFNVESVQLKDSNLIEASAGTGKTFSIGILILRLILEKKLNLSEILMVTFTKAAVAELETRIRKFIRQAMAYSQKRGNCDDTIRRIVDNSIENIGQNNVVSILRKANQSLDDTAIFTIHSFCQKTLNEFAFETGQAFSAEVIENSISIVDKAINEYWRQKITKLDYPYLRLLVDENISIEDVVIVVSKALSGKYFVYNRDLNLTNAFEGYFEQKNVIDRHRQEYNSLFASSPERDFTKISQKNAIKMFAHLSEDNDAFRDKLIEKKKTAYVEKLFPNLLDTALMHEGAITTAKEKLRDIKCFLYGEAIADTKEYIRKQKQELNVFTYDDLIHNLAYSVGNDSDNLLNDELNKKYKAVFIDEFQDTDKMQYDIFNGLFGKRSIMFYIGDPKQSIYGFRGADIDTYKYAASQVANVYTMSHNFRSTPNMISALNSFFSVTDDAFCDDKIKFEKVKAGTSLSELQYENEDVKNISQIFVKNNKEIASAVGSEIYHLLTSDYFIKGRKLKPSDVAVLVRTKSQALDIKKSLSEMNIPAVNIDDAKVLQSQEAQLILYVLQACLSPDKANINRALLNDITAYVKTDILNINDQLELRNFKEIKDAWTKYGVYSAMSLFLKLYGVGANLLNEENRDGERSLTNILQIIELLHKTESNNEFLPSELISYLQKLIAGAQQQGDEYVQRMESDDDAVQIVTIHSSKGLAYNIVFAPYLDLNDDFIKARTFIEYKDPDIEKYCISQIKTDRELELYRQQTQQENRRLIYVCLTRTVYKAYIITTSKGSVKAFLSDQYNSTYIETQEAKEFSAEKYLHNETSIRRKAMKFEANISSSWKMLSFSSLNYFHQTYPSVKQSYKDNYDEFVFDKLGKGNIIGNFLHELFENVDFSFGNFTQTIQKTGKVYPTVYKEEYLEQYDKLMYEVLTANLGTDEAWCLKNVNNDLIIPEMEFFFDIQNFTPSKIAILCEKIRLDDTRSLEGLMTGFIDLFFQYENKYYILDWKSNFLGNSINDYNHDKLDEAMTANNYHLQYLIYTIAIKRYLEMRLPNFDYERDFGGVYYMFLRGCRENTSTGVFYDKPSKSVIEDLDALFSV